MTTIPSPGHSGLPVGTKLGSYLIQGELGRGGFGITYKAIDTRLDRPVVIKEYVPQDFATRRADMTVGPISAGQAEGFQLGLDSFLKEAQTLAKFHHPNIAPVLDFFQSRNGTAFMVMPFLEGETLAARLDRTPGGRMAEKEILVWLGPLLDGLQIIHAAGFLHRDLKPENICLLRNGTPLLIDFGSARNALVSRSRNLSVVLTPGYAPVEQYSANAATQGPWTDLYSLGAVLYRCLTGAVPPDSTERQDAAINGEPDPLRAKLKELPILASPALAAAVEGCLRLARKERIQGVAELRQVLKADHSRRFESHNKEHILDLTNRIYSKTREFGRRVGIASADPGNNQEVIINLTNRIYNKAHDIGQRVGIISANQGNNQEVIQDLTNRTDNKVQDIVRPAGTISTDQEKNQEKILRGFTIISENDKNNLAGPPNGQSAAPQPEKYGGCLILLGLQLVIGSLILFFAFISVFEAPGLAMIFGLWLFVSLLATVQFFDKKSAFPKSCIVYNIICIVFTIGLGATDALGGIIWSIIWIIYLLNSKHVKRVFTK